MGKLEFLMNKLRSMKENFKDKELTPEVDDRALTLLRRERQKQLNELEKLHLKKVIKSHNHQQARRYVYGIKRINPKFDRPIFKKNRGHL
jgi:hypothetical protein